MVRTERSIGQSGIPVCPYWKEYVVQVHGGRFRMLALCGRVRGEQLQAEDTDIGPRLTICPWYQRQGPYRAYHSPAILETWGDLQAVDFNPGESNVLCTSGHRGAAGIEDLRHAWPSAKQRFLAEEWKPPKPPW